MSEGQETPQKPEKKPRPRVPMPQKKNLTGILLWATFVLFAACVALFLLGISWRSQTAELKRKLAKQERFRVSFEQIRAHLALMDRLARKPDPEPEELREMAKVALEKLERVAEDLEESEEVFLLMGRAWEFLYHLDYAHQRYTKAVSLRDDSPAWYDRGMLGIRRLFRRSVYTIPENEWKQRALEATDDLRKFYSFWPGLGGKSAATAAVSYLSGNIDDNSAREVAIQMDDTNWMLHFVHALALRDSGKNREALAPAQTAARIYPYAAEPYALIADLLEKLDRKEAAAGFFDRAIAVDPYFTEAYLRLAMLHQSEGRFDDAWRRYDQAVQLAPKGAGPYRTVALDGLAVCAFEAWKRLGRTDKSLLARAHDACSEYLKIMKGDFKFEESDLRPLLAKILIARDDAEGAVRALESVPDKPAVLEARAEARDKLGRWADAEKDYDALLKLAKEAADKARLLARRGAVRARAGKREEALADLRAVVELEPRSPSARYEVAALLFEMGKTDDALEGVREVLDIKPKDARALILRARALLQKKDAAGAVQAATEAIESDRFLPSDLAAQALLVRGDAHAEGRDRGKAKQDWQEALKRDESLKPGVDERLKD